MAKRISRKLLVGLGSTITLTTTGVLTGFGVKSLVDVFETQNQLTNQFNQINPLGINDIPLVNTADGNMFNFPKLKRTSFGDVQKGQTVTPYGWLSQVDDNASRLALVGWNGEILWSTNNFRGNFVGKIYDVKYDWKSDTVVLTRYAHSNGGFVNPAMNQKLAWLFYEVLDAKTGETILVTEINNWKQIDIHDVIKNNFITRMNSKRLTNLFNIDLSSWDGNNNQVLLNYTPNFMHLMEKNATDTQHSLPSFKTVLENFAKITFQIIIHKNYNNTNRPGVQSLNADWMIKAANGQINLANNSWNTGNETLNLSDFVLLANPFFTTGTQAGQMIAHFIVANKTGNIYHKTMGYSLTPSGRENLPQYDKTEQIDFLEVLPDQWSNAKLWSDDFVNANLRVNKNILNSNSVVFAYPYAASQNASNNFPLFNVAQLLIDPATGLIDKNNTNTSLKTTNFDFGKQIYDFWNANQENRQFNPWPLTRTGWQATNTNHNYNRLISVSPFDNTIIYAANPNYNNYPAFTTHNDHEANWANFWIASNNNPSGKGKYHPILIPNDPGLGGYLNGEMMAIAPGANAIANIYQEGFLFDIGSLMTNGNQKSLNLYYNSNPNAWRNFGGAIKTVRIGLLTDVLKNDRSNSLWLNNITNQLNISSDSAPEFNAKITNTSFSTFIHARANLNKWYPRTWQNINGAANKYVVGDQINGNENSSKRVVVNRFGKLNDPNINTIESVDLLSHWKDPSLNLQAPPNYDRLAVKRAKILVKQTATYDPNNQQQMILPVETIWKPADAIIQKYQQLFNANGDVSNQIATKLTLVKNEQLTNVSQEIDREWSMHAKMTQFTGTTDNLVAEADFNIVNNPFLEQQILKQNKTQLASKLSPNFRLLLQIEKPQSANWNFTNSENYFFAKYPVVPKTGEVGFQTVLSRFIEWKVRNLKFKSISNAADALQNITINAYIGLDSTYNNVDKTVYHEGLKEVIQIDEITNQLLIYQDTFNGDRKIYTQQAATFEDAKNWGWGAKGVAAVANSWKQNEIPRGVKFLTKFNPVSFFSDNLVRLENPNAQQLLKAKYDPNNNTTLEIIPLNTNEFNNRFKFFNQLGLIVKFEYLNYGDSQNDWKQLGSNLTDQQISTQLTNSGNNPKLTFNNVSSNIDKIRFRLVNYTNNENSFIDFGNNFVENNPKFISDAYKVDPKIITINNDWFKEVQLSPTDGWSNLLNQQDFENYENQIFAKNILLNQEKSKFKFQYKLATENTWLDRNQFVQKLNDSLNQFPLRSIIAFWNESASNGIKINVKIVKQNLNDTSIEIVDTNNRPDPNGYIKTDNLKTKVDLSSYLNVLQTEKTTAIQVPNQDGKISSFNPPSLPGETNTFNKLANILSAVGIIYQYKKWDITTNVNNPNWSSWIEEKNNVDSYNVSKPEIKLGFKTKTDHRVKLFNGQTEINENSEFILKLDLPKVVKLSNDLITNFINSNPLSGNTFNLEFNAQQETNFINKIIEFNNKKLGPNNQDFNSLADKLEIKYAMGRETEFYNSQSLKNELSSRQTDQESNKIRFKLTLKQDENNDFKLDGLALNEQILLEDNNSIVKKYVHGNNLESELNSITVSQFAESDGNGGMLFKLNYTYPTNIQKLVNGTWSNLRLEFSYKDLAVNEDMGNDPETEWVDSSLPNEFNPKHKKIYVRVGSDDSDDSIYVYGPKVTNKLKKGIIDLTNLKIPVRINSEWFKQTKLNNTGSDIVVSDILTEGIFNTFKNSIWEKMKKINPNLAQEDLDKLELKFNFNGQTNLNSTQLINAIDQFQKDYNANHLGILDLWNGVDNSTKSQKIEAVFVTKDPSEQKIEFVDIAGNNNPNLTGVINTAGINTEVDLSKYVNVLKTQLTNVILKNGQAGTIESFEPPRMPLSSPAGFLSNKTYDQIAKRLNDVGIKIFYQQLGTSSQGWVEKDQVKSYDQTKGILNLAFDNQSQNIILDLGTTVINSGANTYKNPIVLQLNAPKQITITTSDVEAFIRHSGISGNTKYLEIDQALTWVTKLINDIKEKNKNLSNNASFLNAPIKMLFSLGGKDFYELTDLKNELAKDSNNTDLPNNRLVFKFVIDSSQAADWIIASDQNQYEIYPNSISSVAPIKIYVNDNGLWNNLSSNTNFSGSNKALKWIWPDGNETKVNEQNQIIKAPGIGLKIQFSFKADADVNDPNTVSDPKQGWSDQRPTSFELTQKSVWIRIVALDGYVYEKGTKPNTTNQKIVLDLTRVKQDITINNDWLNQSFNIQEQFIDKIKISDLDQYEKQVQSAMIRGGLDQNTIDTKLSFEYQFNGENLTKSALVQKILTYKNNVNNTDFGILKLSNGVANSGKEIRVKIVKKDPNNQSYTLTYQNGDNHLLDTSNVKTKVQLTNVVNWLKSIKVNIKEGSTTNSIKELLMPRISGTNDLFNQKEWNLFEKGLNSLGINISYRNLLDHNLGVNDNWGTIASVNSYNPNIGQFQIRFEINQTIGSNLELAISSETINSNNSKSDAINVELAVKKKLQISQAFINEFINAPNLIGANSNTKFLTIEKSLETKMINAIKNENAGFNPNFNNADLIVEYQMEKANNLNNSNWLRLDQFIAILKNSNLDKNTNEINFRFRINPDNNASLEEFSVDETAHVLIAHQPPMATTKIAYYINTNDLEAKANGINVTGTSQNLQWDFNGLKISEKNNETFVNLNSGVGLKIEFTTKENPNYNDPIGNATNDIKTGWTTIKPNQIAAETKQLHIRLVPQDGFVYQAKLENKANVHLVNLDNLKILIQVDQGWITKEFLTVANNEFINNLQLSDLEKFQESVLNNISDNELRSKVQLLFTFRNGTTTSYLSAQELFNKIQEILTSNSNPDYGILQLKNESIKAVFLIKDPNSNYQIINQNNSADVNNVTADVNTTKIKVHIDLKNIVTFLKNQMLRVQLKNKPFNTRSLVEINQVIMPEKTPEEIDSTTKKPKPLSDLEWNLFETRLNNLGILIEARALVSSGQANQTWGPINNIKVYDDTINKIELHFKLNNQIANNIVLSVLTDQDVNATNQQSQDFQISLKAPARIVINPQLIQEFINGNPITGNTKFLEIDTQKENDLIDKVIKANSANNQIFDQARGRLKIEYQLGDGSKNNWFERQKFIDYLKWETIDQTTNQISMRFIVENNGTDPNLQIFQVDNSAKEVIPMEVGNKNAKIKIYINENGIEALINKAKIIGTNNNFIYQWPAGFNVDQVNGTVNKITGLKIQYTTKQNLSNQAYDSSQNYDNPQTGWANQQVRNIDPVQRFLAIQLVATDGYIYGPQNKATNNNDQSPDWKVHIINSDQIRSEIKLNIQQGLSQIYFDGQIGATINFDQIKNELENKAKEVAGFVDDSLKQYVDFEYQLVYPNQQNGNWINLDQLKIEIEQYYQDYNNQTLSLLKFSNSNNNLFKIKARFISNNSNYIVLDQNGVTNDQQIQKAQDGYDLKTDDLVTLIDLIDYVDYLKNNDVILGAGSSTNSINGLRPPVMSGLSGSKFLAGQNFDHIKSVFNKLGIIIEFKAPGGATGDAWVSDLDLIKSLNRQNDLLMRFRIDMTNFANQTQKDQWAKSFLIKIKNGDSGLLTNASEYATEAIKLQVNLPIIIDVDAINNLTGFTFKGHTAKIDNKAEIQTKLQEIINKIFKDNSSSGTILDPNKVGLKITFSLNKLDIDNQGTWFELDQFVNLLAASKNNWITNQIYARFELKNNSNERQKYEIENNQEVIINQEDISENADLKIYIHRDNFIDNINTLFATGSTDDYEIENLEKWLLTVPQGLKVQFSADAHAINDPDNATWIDYTGNHSLPKPLNSDKNLWIRFELKSGYIYQELENQINKNHTDPVAINTSKLKVILKLKSDWLKLIILTGNTKIMQIDESKIFDEIQNANILPTGKNNLVELQYSIDQKNWMTKNNFISFLKQQDGAKDANHFILRREDIVVRFNINANVDLNDEYNLNIDDLNLNSSNRDQFNHQLVDETHNQDLEGYININKLKDFTVGNFGIKGTTTKPIFIINNRTNLDNLLQVYASFNDIFDIQFSAKKSGNDWVWEDANTLLKNGILIESNSDYLIQKGVTISPEKFFAIRFVAKANSKYKVYHNDQEQTNGHILDLSPNVRITIEITNPFSSKNKTVGLLFRNDDNSAKYYQSEGGFKLTTFDLNTNTIDKNQSAFDFIKNSGLSQQEQEAIEFVYHIFDSQPTEEQLNEINNIDVINDYNNPTWISITDQMLEENQSGFTKSLKLKVGQFVSVGIRIKKEFAQKEEGFVLKDNQHSIFNPIIDSNLPGRIGGYLVKTDAVKLDLASIKLASLLPSNSDDLLDGFAILKEISLVPDQQLNYLGIGLKLKLYNEYHTKNGKPIILNNKLKLIKRDQSKAVNPTKYYKDATGAEIVDDQNNKIPILKDATGKLVAPIESNQVKFEKLLNDYNNGSFGLNEFDLNNSDFSLFKNQKIVLAYEAKSGLNINNLADFVLDQTNVEFDLKEEISPKIKFAIDNEKNIRYEFQQENFLAENIIYKGNDPLNPDQAISGASEIITPLTLLRVEGSDRSEIISSNNPEESVKIIEEKLKNDFSDQLRFETIYESIDGTKQTFSGANIYRFKNLKNGDRIILKIVANDPDLTYQESPISLFINVRGLVGSAPSKEKLQYLRVEQNGILNGQGSFKILINKPGNDNVDANLLLKGWKFLIQVWDSNHEIKIPWTDEAITGLKNGDKIEWKLVDENDNPVRDAYYNTVAQEHQLDGENIKFNFAQVNYADGLNSKVIVKDEIGKYPIEQGIYPETSGFVISGLQDKIEYFDISVPSLENLFSHDLRPEYVGLDGQGAIKFNPKFFEADYYVSKTGNLVDSTQLWSTYSTNNLVATNLDVIPLNQFLENATFYTVDPILNPYATGFKFQNNQTNTGNFLSNNTQVWVKFNPLQNAPDYLVNDLVAKLPPVTGLTDVSDPMSPIWYVLIALAAIGTLGVLGIAYLLAKRRKLK